MENFDFTESALILAIIREGDIRKARFKIKDFAVLGNAYEFVLDYFREYTSFPSKEVLFEKFENMRVEAATVSFEFAKAEFIKELLYRNARTTIQQEGRLLPTDPKEAVAKMIRRLEDLDLDYSDDVKIYNDGDTGRLDLYRLRKEEQKIRKIVGMRTPFKTLNRKGVGFLPGELVSLYARPNIGKTWMLLKVAAISVLENKRTLLMTPEMTTDALELRMDVILGNMMNYHFNYDNLVSGKGDLNEENYLEYLKAAGHRNLLVCDSIGKSGISIDGIQSLVREHEPQVLLVDQLQLINGNNRSSWENTRDIYREMNAQTNSRQMITFVTNQAKQVTEDRIPQPHRHPQMNEIRDGDWLLQWSDVAMTMAMDKNDSGYRSVKIQKHRNQEVDDTYMKVKFDVVHGNIEEEVVETLPE